MIPASFGYVRAGSVDEALAALAEHGDEAKLLAGGHSLLPLMKLRLARPEVLVDIGRVADLRYVREDGDAVRIGALTTIRQLEFDETLAAHVPLLRASAHAVGDPQVRARGTIGGSLSHGDGASDLPAVALALGARLVIRGPSGTREVDIDDFFLGFLETAVGEDEMLTEIVVPKCGDAGWSFQKFNRRAQDWAIVGVALVHGNGSGPTGVGLVNMSSRPLRAAAAEEALRNGASATEVGALAAEGTEAPSDLNARAEYREYLARVLVERAVAEATI